MSGMKGVGDDESGGLGLARADLPRGTELVEHVLYNVRHPLRWTCGGIPDRKWWAR